MKHRIFSRAALVTGALAGVIAISACTPAQTGAPAQSNVAVQSRASVPSGMPVQSSGPAPSGTSTANRPTTHTRPPAASTPAPAAQVYLADCQDHRSLVDTIKETNIVLACDSSVMLRDMHWSTWNGRYAEGTGQVVQDGCEPDCGDGTLYSNPVTVTFDKPVKTDCGEFWTDVAFAYLGKPVGATPGAHFTPQDPVSFCGYLKQTGRTPKS